MREHTKKEKNIYAHFSSMEKDSFIQSNRNQILINDTFSISFFSPAFLPLLPST